MNCSEVQQWLLDAEDLRVHDPRDLDPPAEAAPAGIAQHLQTCAACRQLAQQLAQLEQQWRQMPLPPRCAASQAEFLFALPARSAPAAPGIDPKTDAASPDDPEVSGRRTVLGSVSNPPLRSLSRRRFLRWATAAAAGATAGGVGLWTLLGGGEADAAEQLLDSMVDWNLQITGAQSAPTRAELYRTGETRFRSALARVNMPAEHVAVALRLLENGAWLAGHHDALDEAERFDHLAERLLKLAGNAGEKGHYRRMDRLLDQYCRVLESGVNPNIEMAEDSGALDFQSQRRLERLVLDNPDRVRELDALLQRAPKASRYRIRRAMGLAGTRGKKSHPAGRPNQRKRSPSPPDQIDI